MTAIEDEVNNKRNITGAQKFILGLIFLMPIIMVVTLALAWWQYPEPYEFFQEFISNFGGRLSNDGYANDVSSLIMIIGFTTVSLITLAIAIIYLVRKELKRRFYKAAFAFFLTIGAVGIAIPHDQSPALHYVHGIGAITFIFGFAMFNFAAQLLRFKKRWPKPEKAPVGFYIDAAITIIVFIAMIVFVIFYLIELIPGVYEYLAEIGQKIVLVVDLLAAYYIDIEDI